MSALRAGLAASAALVALAGAAGPAPGAAGRDGGEDRAERLVWAELELSGPAADLVVEVPGAGRAFLAGSFPAGASARFELLLPAPLLAAGASPGAWPGYAVEARLQGSGRADVRPLPERELERRARFEALPRGLRARAPVTPPEVEAPAPAPSALWLTAGLFALGWQLRRRAGATLALGLLGAAAVFWLARAPAAQASFLVAEGQGTDPRFVLVEAARGRLFLGGTDDLLRLESRPARAELVLTSTPGRADLAVEGRGTALFAFRDGAALSAGRERNGVFDLERVWLREAGAAAWTALGPWPLGAPLPSAAGAASDPPGWLIAALPQGPGILVGGGAGRWLRWVDVPAPPAGAEKPAPGH